jgi:hypothetical protein
MKISESPYGMTETYTVKFWYQNAEGFHRQIDEDFYCNSKSAHDQVEHFAKQYLTKFYKEFRIISVTYN